MGSRAENRALLWVPWLWTSGSKRSGYLASFHIEGPGLIPNEKERVTAYCSLEFSLVISQTWSKSGSALLPLTIETRTTRSQAGHKLRPLRKHLAGTLGSSVEGNLLRQEIPHSVL